MKQETDIPILIADVGRSGQGWLSYMLCYILNAEFLEPYELLEGRKFTKSEHIFSLTRGNLPGREKTKYSMVIKTHKCPGNVPNLTDKVICLSRDPRDVAVAYYNMQLVQSRTRKFRDDILLNRRIIHYIQTADRWTKFYKFWDNRDCYKVRYEDLSMDLKNTLKGILTYLQVDTQDSIIEKAMEEFAFEKVAGRPKGQEDKNNLEFRRGIVGDYKGRFNKLEMMIFKRICGQQAKKLGYNL